MGKPRVAIVLLRKRFHFVYQLQALLGKYIDFISYSLEEGIDSYINCDLALVPSYEVAGIVKRYLMPQTELLVVRRTISKSAWDKLSQIPPNTKVLVVNTYWEMSTQTVAVLYELGLYQLELIPFNNNQPENYRDIRYAITPNERESVPGYIEHAIDIGTRPVDVSTIFDILHKLNLVNQVTKQLLYAHMKEMVPMSPGFVNLFYRFYDTKEDFEQLLDMIDDVVLTFDIEQHVKIYNQQAVKFFSHILHLADQPLENLFAKISAKEICEVEEVKDAVVILQGTYYVVNKSPILKNGRIHGGILTIRPCDSIQNQNTKIHEAMVSQGYIAKYTFANILGTHQAIQQAITFAQKAARTESDILIEAESGTGKELFAQAIHNYSTRRKGPFVAFNCAALSGSLLESELFGYEEGAFTGASRRGKRGLFEMANQGTIFLDEISEVSTETQVKLLRVLQERELIRVGGTKIIPIDIRVIAATNQNLYQLVEEKKFRMDLYFRLNVFNLRIPPLRERKSDISYLIKAFLREKNVRVDFPQETMQILLAHQWAGNIRELRNCIEYMVSMDEGFEPQNLPGHILRGIQRHRDQEERFLRESNPGEEGECILKILFEAQRQCRYIGRKEISAQLKEQDIFLSEQSVRTALKKLNAQGLVCILKGRAGTKITEKGKRFFKSI
ncbi:sigma 54-interacting transcriptional regulator [Anaerosinus massiliensis]|uniref:sigma 54-interacting transcriptional regulator n=1 Tax=Massilibacillus massiliensis TaxID=1806837 RepID=UPI000DA62F72|nr:sigma 54-interacting transcriptional regulator [Massilibacillus massiliensis]